jgi:Zn-dependent protease/CBS domain-containing protein
MKAHLQLGRVLGIRIGLHYSWLFIAALLGLSLAGHFQLTQPEWSAATVWGSAAITAALFFLAIVLHELAHSAVALARGIPVQSITLFALGGVAQMDGEASDPATEFWMAAAGPLASALIGTGCLAAAFLAEGMLAPASPVVVTLQWLGYVNVGLALFNLIPGFPLDGGRIFRALVWKITGNPQRATRLAGFAGEMVAFGLIIAGLLSFLMSAGFGGLWIAVIGWFLLRTARTSSVQSRIREALHGLIVGDVMNRNHTLVDGRANIETFVQETLLRTGRRCFLIADNGEIAGVITPEEVKGVPRPQWPYKTLRDAMRRLDELQSVGSDTAAAEALQLLTRDNIRQLPVVSEGRVEGIVTREDILQAVATRSELAA